jgi:hypothetical protein
MSKLAKYFTFALLLFILVVPTQALAAAPAASSSSDIGAFLRILQEVLAVIKGMTALATALTLIVNFAKSKGWIPDDTADVAFQS